MTIRFQSLPSTPYILVRCGRRHCRRTPRLTEEAGEREERQVEESSAVVRDIPKETMLCGVDRNGGPCLPAPVLAVDLVLVAVFGAISVISFSQFLRIRLHYQLGWTRQKIIHLMVGSSSLGFTIYFISIPVANCKNWSCWSRGCGFILMACPQILFLATFLLLLSFWVDLCHQASDKDDDEEEDNYSETLLNKTETTSRDCHTKYHTRCCNFPIIHVGRRQKIVVMVVLLTFIFMGAFAVLIWIGKGKNPIDSSLVAMLYLDAFSLVMLLLGVALACYGGVLFSKMSRVRSEMVSAEMWKVASLAAVSVICFSSSAVLELVTNAPLQMMPDCQLKDEDSRITPVLLFSYYLIGSSVPLAYVLWVMREMPQQHSREKPQQERIVTFVRDGSGKERFWTVATTSTTEVSRGSPI